MSIRRIGTPQINSTAVIAPTADIYGDVAIDRDVFILFGVVIRAELDRVSIGAETNIQDNTVIHCDEGIPCVIGSRVTVGHAAVVHGATVEDKALIGIGAKALNGSVVGEGAILGAGSVLAENKTVPPWTLAIGVPAKPVRELTADELERSAFGIDHYLELAAAYREIFSKQTE